MLKRIILPALLILSLLNCVSAQDPLQERYAKTIEPKQLMDHIKALASPEMEGRLTGTPGQKRAAHYLYRQFLKIGLLTPNENRDSIGYFQPFNLVKTTPEALIATASKTYRHLEKITYLGPWGEGQDSLSLYVLGWADPAKYHDLKLSNKAVLFFTKNLRSAPIEAEHIARETGARVFLYANLQQQNQYKQERHKMKSQWRLFRRYHFESGSANQSFLPDSAENPRLFNYFKNKPKTYEFMIAPQVVEDMLGIRLKEIKRKIQMAQQTNDSIYWPNPSPIAYHYETQSTRIETENVLAYIPGSDKKEEVIVISAHYDHLGQTEKSIFYGANDNASGTAGILEIAEAFQKAYEDGNGPRRSLLFVAFTGEEIGIYGSRYYVEHPLFPLDQTLVDFNLDMIGRTDDKHETNENNLYLLGTNHLAPELHRLSDSLNQIYTQLDLNYEYDYPSSGFYRASDQANFVEKGVPAIFYFNGLHSDYHRPSDVPNKINARSAAKVARLAFHTIWELANREKGLERVKKSK